MIRFGILGAGNIARRFAASLVHEDSAELVAVSCRSPERAQAWVREAGLSLAHAHAGDGAHASLLADTSVDAIYLALPHALHHDWAIAALKAGKAVLCEKPACLTAQEMAEVAACARTTGTLFMEAMKPRFQPLYPQVLEAARTIAPIIHVEASLCNDMLRLVEGTGSYHLSGGAGAGVVLDCGTYCASWLEELCPGLPTLCEAHGEMREGVDVYADATFDYGGITARLECAFDRGRPRSCMIEGERGRIVVEELHRPTRATVERDGRAPRVLEAAYRHDDFFGEIHHFCELLCAGIPESPIMPLQDSIHCALILDEVRAAF